MHRLSKVVVRLFDPKLKNPHPSIEIWTE